MCVRRPGLRTASVLGLAHRGDSLGGVCAVGDERVDEQLVAVASGDVQWRVSVLVFTVNFCPCKRTKKNKCSFTTRSDALKIATACVIP